MRIVIFFFFFSISKNIISQEIYNIGDLIIKVSDSSNIKYTDTMNDFVTNQFDLDMGEIEGDIYKYTKFLKYIGRESVMITNTFTGDPHFICEIPYGYIHQNEIIKITICFYHLGRYGSFHKSMGFYLSNGNYIIFKFKGDVKEDSCHDGYIETIFHKHEPIVQPSYVEDLTSILSMIDIPRDSFSTKNPLNSEQTLPCFFCETIEKTDFPCKFKMPYSIYSYVSDFKGVVTAFYEYYVKNSSNVKYVKYKWSKQKKLEYELGHLYKISLKYALNHLMKEKKGKQIDSIRKR